MSDVKFEFFNIDISADMPPGTTEEDIRYLLEKALNSSEKYGGIDWNRLERTPIKDEDLWPEEGKDKEGSK
jgi:hypothetical protein